MSRSIQCFALDFKPHDELTIMDDLYYGCTVNMLDRNSSFIVCMHCCFQKA